MEKKRIIIESSARGMIKTPSSSAQAGVFKTTGQSVKPPPPPPMKKQPK